VELALWKNADNFLGFTVPFKLYDSSCFGEECIIPTETDVCARTEACAALAYDNAPSSHKLSTIAFHAKSLRIAVAAVPGAANPFLMSHVSCSYVLMLTISIRV
jgi:hypothetical protein